MEGFYARNMVLRKDCVTFIENTLKAIEGNKCSLIDDTLDPEEDDIYFDLPVAILFGRNDYGVTYAITNIRLEDDNLWFNGVSTDDYISDYSFAANELDTQALVEIADILGNL
jgi:hypothetical protein